MRPADRDRFDALLQQEIAALPAGVLDLLEEVPVVAEDKPAPDVLSEFGIDPADADELCGLHSGRAITERGVGDPPELPNVVMLYREGIVAHAGGWAVGDEAVAEEIRITLLHEIGHEFGLDEDDLERLGYA
ncbi:MAG: metallopeptidase family protein [Planctomycetota bacterium]